MIELPANTRALFGDIGRFFAPPPKFTGSQWADATRKLSSEASAEPGQWRTSRAEYQREILDSVTDPTIERIVLKTSAQIGKTEILLNAIGIHIDYDPCPILALQPTLDMGEAFSKDRIGPMLRDTPQIGNKLAEGKSRDAKNTILHKSFIGGHVTIAGANSPASLASRPIRVVLADEVDRYPASAGKEGDPLNLAIKRTSTFWNRKIIIVSTPTVKGESRIDSAFSETDQRYYNIPCPRCTTPHVLQWGNVVYDRDSPAQGDPKKALFRCPHCDGYYTNAEKNAAVKRGEWIATAPFNGRAGFHLWEAYSPWKTISEVVADYLEAKGNAAKMQVFVNTSLGEVYEGIGETLNDNDLITRAEEYESEVPGRGLLLTCGVDTQDDRLEAEVVAWGVGEESWSVDYRVFHGDPDIKEGQHGSPWDDLTDYLRKSWRHKSGADVAVSWTFIDSAGHRTTAVYEYCKRHKGQRVFPIVGRAGEGKPIVGPPNKKRTGKNRCPVNLYNVGVDSAKSIVYSALRLDEPGPGYCHFPKSREPEWYRQITSEKLVTKHVKGYQKKEWVKESGRRNEALDCRVYAYAALVMSGPHNWQKYGLRITQKAATAPARQPIKVAAKPAPAKIETEEQPTSQVKPSVRPENGPLKPRRPATPTRPARRGGFVSRWRN